jgi:N-terminal acetyltransferase B complex non-catalytic subunit
MPLTCRSKAWKAHILFCHTDNVHRQRGIDEALELCQLEPPVTDIDALNMLHNTLKKLDRYAEIARAIWQKAARAAPQQLEIQLRWFTHASEAGDWKTAQKVWNMFPFIFVDYRKCLNLIYIVVA